VRPLIANIGNYAALSRVGEGVVGICQAPPSSVGPLPPAFIPSGLGRQRRRGPMIATTLCFETARPTGGTRVLTQISIKLALKHFPPFLPCPASRSIQRGGLRNWRLHRGTSNCSDFRRGRRRRQRRRWRRRRRRRRRASSRRRRRFPFSFSYPFFFPFFPSFSRKPTSSPVIKLARFRAAHRWFLKIFKSWLSPSTRYSAIRKPLCRSSWL